MSYVLNRERRDSVVLDERAKNSSKISYDEAVNKLGKYYRQGSLWLIDREICDVLQESFE
jgi:hypothetical protein